MADPAGVIEGDLGGARVRLEVQPLARAGSATVLTAVVTVVKAPERGSLNITSDFTARGGGSSGPDLSDVRLFLPEGGLLASPAKTADGRWATSRPGNVGLEAGASAGLRAIFGALPVEAERADVLWPILGVVAGVPIVDGAVPVLPPYGDSPPRDVEVVRAVGGEVRAVTARSSQLAGAVTTEHAPAQTRVVLAADVLFALDRADLSPQANAALDAAAAAIKAAGPGPVKVTGHTDDQGTEQYNLDLSNRRAQAVAATLAPRLAPGSYPLEVSGRGEAEPTVEGTKPEARAANRRVELLVARRQQAAPPTLAAPGVLPEGGGPRAKAAEGLAFDQSDGSVMRLRAERAVREGSWLRVDLTGTVERIDPRTGTTDFLIDLRDPGPRSAYGRDDAAGVGVLDGSVLHLPAVVDVKGLCACPNGLFGVSIHGLEQRRFSVWVGVPQSLGDTVVVQLPREQGRLLDVPVAPK